MEENILKKFPELSEILVTNRAVQAKIDELSKRIVDDLGQAKRVVALCILKGAVVFYSELCQRLAQAGVDVRFEFVRTESYKGTESTGDVSISMTDNLSLAEEHVLIVEDIIDTGRSISKLTQYIRNECRPKSIKVCCLLDKPSRRVVDYRADYRGIQVPDKFVVGFGMDYEQKYRALPFIAVLNPENS